MSKVIANYDQGIDNQGTVQQPVADRCRATPVLDDLQIGDVQRNGSSRDTVGSPTVRMQQAGQDGGGSYYSKRHVGGYGAGSSQGRVLRQKRKIAQWKFGY